MKQWFVGETVRNREDEAALSVARYGLEAYVPFDRKYKRCGRRIMETQAPRFGVYIFLLFDRRTDPWPELIHGRSHKEYFKRILSDADRNPIPVPTRAIDVIRAYSPPPMEAPQPIVFKPGQPVLCTISPGVTVQAVFVAYRGETPMVEVWIFGRKSTVPVSHAQLETLDDGQYNVSQAVHG